ncbi:MAG: hypothetical protein IPQ06_15725 [Chitinophagaceae bacterium]|nr:hypothetical protein [Chitinophagaceae bacterium]
MIALKEEQQIRCYLTFFTHLFLIKWWPLTAFTDLIIIPLRSYDPNLFQDLAYDIGQIKGKFLIENRLKLLYKKAIDLIALLKKEYHLSERTLQRSPS